MNHRHVIFFFNVPRIPQLVGGHCYYLEHMFATQFCPRTPTRGCLAMSKRLRIGMGRDNVLRGGTREDGGREWHEGERSRSLGSGALGEMPVHEIRDAIHTFVRLKSGERDVLDSRPLQRLRHIHQLGLSHLIYPGATHRRFEHSLGVMELAGRVFDVVTHADALTDEIRKLLPELTDEDKLRYWKRVLRVAALCHDIGHLPFSHAAEKELLPEGWDHERFTRELILSNDMQRLWGSMTPPLRSEDVVKLAVGPAKGEDLVFSNWEAVLSEIIVGDSFGVDRMDYLLRDSHHVGVPYGRFDHYRLIDTLRILQSPPSGEGEEAGEPTLGVLEGGIQSAEALLLARYLMYSQVYLHPVRRVYDIHLRDFLISWLPGGKLPTIQSELLRITDNEVLVDLVSSSNDSTKTGFDPARRIVQREHFRELYRRHPADIAKNPQAARKIFDAAKEKFGDDAVRYDSYRMGGGVTDFPVLSKDRRIVSALSMSETISHLPFVAIDFVFIDPERLNDGKAWLEKERAAIIQPVEETS